MTHQVGMIEGEGRTYLPLEKHTAESKWQFCNCKTCQDIRHRLENAPGKELDMRTYRRKDEKY